MSYRVRTIRDTDELRRALGAIGHYFGWEPSDEDATRFGTLLPLDRVHVVTDGGSIVAAAGAFPFELTLPARPAPCAGVSIVGVLPSHRRRGLLRRMMATQLRDVREREEPVAALWASEETIYGRFGYGLASMSLVIDADRHATGVRDVSRSGEVRLVDHDEAARIFPRLYDRVRKRSPGFVSRSAGWWDAKQLSNRPDRRRGAGPLVRALLERDGRAVGYALYRIAQEGSTEDDWQKTVKVVEAFGVDDSATHELWRFLFSIDWTDRVAAFGLPVDHSLLLVVDRVNKLRAKLYDGLWLRPVSVPDALAARGVSGDGRVTLEVTSDPLFADNVGTWTLEGRVAKRASRRPDARLDVQALGALLLGGFSFAQLERAGRVEEGTRGGLSRADVLFRVDRAPSCPEIF